MYVKKTEKKLSAEVKQVISAIVKMAIHGELGMNIIVNACEKWYLEFHFRGSTNWK